MRSLNHNMLVKKHLLLLLLLPEMVGYLLDGMRLFLHSCLMKTWLSTVILQKSISLMVLSTY